MCPPFISLYPSQIYHIEAWHGVAWPVMVFAYYEKLWLFFGGEGKNIKVGCWIRSHSKCACVLDWSMYEFCICQIE